ncbi:unnamed protein product [Periconia digitata]|uniref:Uncharacterized protein n=1 Tax=Periconia digitata TaxID=1303443 RepID=A0A9W4XJ95_9PLEO|nr:unnamed protein product [Periconia digitata]
MYSAIVGLDCIRFINFQTVSRAILRHLSCRAQRFCPKSEAKQSSREESLFPSHGLQNIRSARDPYSTSASERKWSLKGKNPRREASANATTSAPPRDDKSRVLFKDCRLVYMPVNFYIYFSS